MTTKTKDDESKAQAVDMVPMGVMVASFYNTLVFNGVQMVVALELAKAWMTKLMDMNLVQAQAVDKAKDDLQQALVALASKDVSNDTH